MSNNKNKKGKTISKRMYYALMVLIPLAATLVTHILILLFAGEQENIYIVDLAILFMVAVCTPLILAGMVESKVLKVSDEVDDASEKMMNVMKIGGIALLVIAIIVAIAMESCKEPTADYYIDYNNNGKMDDSEYVYSEDADGTEHWDFDGDGWWDN